jgi:3-hydroxymyristoyl/3-hydroxydecanoyl-(acyl carrier protein) dehydratase
MLRPEKGNHMSLKTISVGIDRIKELLPHRDPFLFVDKVTRLEEGVRIRAERELRPEEPHYEGHFPGNPIMPGVLITEALAQTSGLLLALTATKQGEDTECRLFYLAKADMKWATPARPGDTLILESKHVRTLSALVAFSVKAFTKSDNVASGTLTLARVKGDD